jgi:sortase A
MRSRWALPALSLLLALTAVTLLGEQAVLGAKARLANWLIGRAFAAHLEDGQVHLPWSWADIHPIAQLEVPRLAEIRHVLTGGSGTSMAFGLGHLDGTAAPATSGNCVLVGHRDGQFAFLERLALGDTLRVRTAARDETYVVRELSVIAEDDPRPLVPTVHPRLTLVTCYPFGGLLPTSQRYLVTCDAP